MESRRHVVGALAVLPVFSSERSLDATFDRWLAPASGLVILPARHVETLGKLAIPVSGERQPDVLLFDGRGQRRSVAYRAISRIRASGWQGGLVIAVEESDLSMMPGARSLGATDFVLPSMAPSEIAVRLACAQDARPERLAPPLADAPASAIVLEWRTHEIVVGAQRIQLTLRELQLLEVFLSRPGVTLAKRDLVHLAWGMPKGSGGSLAATYISSLRRKLARFGAEFGVRTISGVGYRFEA